MSTDREPKPDWIVPNNDAEKPRWALTLAASVLGILLLWLGSYVWTTMHSGQDHDRKKRADIEILIDDLESELEDHLIASERRLTRLETKGER